MKDGKELVKDMTYDSKDVSAYSYEDLVSATCQSADHIHAQQRNSNAKATRS